MVYAFIGIGSNVGDKEDNVERAIQLLKKKVKILKVSSFYKTEPMYYEKQDWFMNCVVKVETRMKPKELLTFLRRIEDRLGKNLPFKYGPRTIDLDILFYGKEVVSEDELEIPHPRIKERGFVLIPLSEIEPDFIHPVLKVDMKTLAGNLPGRKEVIKLGRKDL